MNSSISIVLVETKRFKPIYLSNKSVQYETIQNSNYGSGSGYIHRITRAIIASPGNVWSQSDRSFSPSNNQFNRFDTIARIGGHIWKISGGLIVSLTTKRLVYLLVKDVETDRWVGLVDKTFDHVSCGLEYRTMRKHVRKGLTEARNKGVEIRHVSPAVLEMFKLKPSYNGDSRFYGTIVSSIRGNLKEICGR